MTTTSLTNDQDNDEVRPDLLTDLLDPILAHAVRHWWQSQHEQLATPSDPQPPIPSPPVHILQVVPRPYAPSATLAAFAPFVSVPPQWSMTPGIGGCYNVDVASYHGKVWMLDVFLKLYHLGRYPPATVAAEAVLPSSGHDSEHDDQVDDAMVNDGHDHMTEAADDDDEAFAADDDNDEYVAEYVPAPPSPLMDSKCPFLYSHNALNAASAYNQTLVLDWWLKTHRKHPKLFPLEYTEAALDNASWCGHVQVLDWWLDSGLELRYSWAALADASEAGQVEVLDWWLRAQQAGRLERDYSSRVLDRASIENHVPVLDWWLDKGELPTLEGKYSDQALAVATSRGHLEVIKWWRSKVEAGVLPKSAFHVEKVVRSASAFARMELLEWVLQEGLLTEEVKKDLVRKLSFADGAEFNEWKPEVREWWVNQAGVVIPAI